MGSEVYTLQETASVGKVKPVVVTTTKSLGNYERLIQIANGTYTITLPKVAENFGRIFAGLQYDSGTNSVTITSSGDADDWTDLVVNAAGEGFAVISNGRGWIVLSGATS